MADWTSQLVLPSGIKTLSPRSAASIGGNSGGSLGTHASGTWPAANRAIFIPFRLTQTVTVTLMWVFNGATVNGNFDIGIYDKDGTRLVSNGVTAQVGVNQIQTVDITDTVIGPGLFYMALAFDNTVATVFRSNLAFRIAKVLGVAQMDNGYVGGTGLVATASFAPVDHYSAFVYGLTVSPRSFV